MMDPPLSQSLSQDLFRMEGGRGNLLPVISAPRLFPGCYLSCKLMVLMVNLPAEPYPLSLRIFMCVSKQLRTYGSGPSQIFRIRTFNNFAQAPKNAILVVPESGTTMKFVKR